MQLAAAACHTTGRWRWWWWVVSRCRRAILIAVLDNVADWLARRNAVVDDGKPLGLMPYLILSLDDLAYGAGLWTGVVRSAIGPLKPPDPDLTMPVSNTHGSV